MLDRAIIMQREISEFVKKLIKMFPELKENSESNETKIDIIKRGVHNRLFGIYGEEIRDLILDNIPMVLAMVNKK